MIGRLPPASVPANTRTRLVYDEPKYRGYEVVLDVYPDVFGYGILLLPKDIAPAERRPVVRGCLDWSERELHVAGALGAALTSRFFELGWIRRREGNRSVEVVDERHLLEL